MPETLEQTRLTRLPNADLVEERARWIVEACHHIAEEEAEIKAEQAAIAARRKKLREYENEIIKGKLGYEKADFMAVFRSYVLDQERQETYLRCQNEMFRALKINGQLDWIEIDNRANGAVPPDDIDGADETDSVDARAMNGADDDGAATINQRIFADGEAAALAGRSKATNPHSGIAGGVWDDGWDEGDRKLAEDSRRLEPLPSQRRRGRPPGVKNKHPSRRRSTAVAAPAALRRRRQSPTFDA